MTDVTPEAPVTEAGKRLLSYAEAMDDRLHADFGIPKAMHFILTESAVAIEAEAVARDREALAAKVRSLPQPGYGDEWLPPLEFRDAVLNALAATPVQRHG